MESEKAGSQFDPALSLGPYGRAESRLRRPQQQITPPTHRLPVKNLGSIYGRNHIHARRCSA
jgi:hypothetical protein